MEIAINPAIEHAEYLSCSAFEAALMRIIECFDFLLPALKKERIHLLFDATMETRITKSGETLISLINSVGDRDLRLKYFLHRRRVRCSISEKRFVELARYDDLASLKDALSILRSEMPVDLQLANGGWLSIGGCPTMEHRFLQITDINNGSEKIQRNSCNLQSLQETIPIFEPSLKHRSEKYVRAGGERVSPMPLSRELAQEVLLTSVAVGNRRFALWQQRVFVFHRTHVRKEIFHGFEGAINEVPLEVLDIL